jgi:ABC-type transport system involved in multi-copper enzyme maturation permease subunit
MVEFLLIGTLLGLVQLAAALPWVAALDPVGFKSWLRRAATTRLGLHVGAVVLLGLLGVLALYHASVTDHNQMVFWGRIYASVLHLQLGADLFVFLFVVLLRLWPQGAAVALAAFREGVRQPLFWILSLGAFVLMVISLVIPYFTFGEDFKMVQEIGYDTIMLAATAFGVIAASMSVSEEIEGKTAITLMSKPISRRQFLLGKFVGILLAALAMTLLLGWFMIWILYIKPRWDPFSVPNPLEKIPDPAWVTRLVQRLDLDAVSLANVQGILLWSGDLGMTGLGMVLGFCQLMVLLAIAVALATRLPMIVNLVVCLVVFFLGHLTPILTAVSQNRFALVHFTAQLFDTLLPALEFYDMGAAIVRDTPLPPGDFALYVGSVTLYSVIYTVIALLFGLILFEDRDLA